MHSSRMRTAHLLTISGGDLPNPAGCLHPGGLDRPLPPVNRMTHRCKNITLPQTSFPDGNKCLTNINLCGPTINFSYLNIGGFSIKATDSLKGDTTIPSGNQELQTKWGICDPPGDIWRCVQQGRVLLQGPRPCRWPASKKAEILWHIHLPTVNLLPRDYSPQPGCSESTAYGTSTRPDTCQSWRTTRDTWKFKPPNYRSQHVLWQESAIF